MNDTSRLASLKWSKAVRSRNPNSRMRETLHDVREVGLLLLRIVPAQHIHNVITANDCFIIQ